RSACSCLSSAHAPSLFLLKPTSTLLISALSLHDALPIFLGAAPHRHRPGHLRPDRPHDYRLLRLRAVFDPQGGDGHAAWRPGQRSEEHTSELQSRENLVCRLLLEKKQGIRRWAHRRRTAG